MLWAHGCPVGLYASHSNSLGVHPCAPRLLNRVLDLEGVTVTDVHPGSLASDGPVVVRLRLRRQVLVCLSCPFRTRHRYDRRPVESRWSPLTWADESAN